MKKLRINFLALLFIGVLCILSSCSKESLDGESGSAAVVWDQSSYNVSNLMEVSVATSSPSSDKDFNLKLALEDSKHSQKQLYLSCTNYIYGEKVDLTTDKYSSQIQFTDGQNTYRVTGGSSNVKAGSYYKLTRKGNHIELIIDLVYSGDNGYEHTLKVKYGGELPYSDYLPSENWQNEPSYHYTFSYDEAPYSYWGVASWGAGLFRCEIANKRSNGGFQICINQFEYNEKIDLADAKNAAEITLSLNNKDTGKDEYHVWSYNSIIEGSYIYMKEGEASSQDEVTIDVKCKDKDGTVHHIQAEYNVFK